MALKPAIIYENDEVYVQYSPEKFRDLLKEYSKDKPVDEALDQIIKDLKKETQHGTSNN